MRSPFCRRSATNLGLVLLLRSACPGQRQPDEFLASCIFHRYRLTRRGINSRTDRRRIYSASSNFLTRARANFRRALKHRHREPTTTNEISNDRRYASRTLFRFRNYPRSERIRATLAEIDGSAFRVRVAITLIAGKFQLFPTVSARFRIPSHGDESRSG